MSEEKTSLHELVCKKFEEIQKIINDHEDKENYAVFAVCTDTIKTGQLLVGTGANLNLGICNSMATSEGTYFAITSSSILFDAYAKNASPDEVMEALGKISPHPSSMSVEDVDLTTLTPKTEA
jgi:hypothetical protein